jgi:hypothetical protein
MSPCTYSYQPKRRTQKGAQRGKREREIEREKDEERKRERKRERERGRARANTHRTSPPRHHTRRPKPSRPRFFRFLEKVVKIWYENDKLTYLRVALHAGSRYAATPVFMLQENCRDANAPNNQKL